MGEEYYWNAVVKSSLKTKIRSMPYLAYGNIEYYYIQTGINFIWYNDHIFIILHMTKGFYKRCVGYPRLANWLALACAQGQFAMYLAGVLAMIFIAALVYLHEMIYNLQFYLSLNLDHSCGSPYELERKLSWGIKE
jgi:hypothetical protein